mmetsp:Transcript_45351/g.151255  ORF Transcript_45351/g.151255 Transcript_45351/m.151255 type:complete len:299 (-) Transcript_45351:822-1718(-)
MALLVLGVAPLRACGGAVAGEAAVAAAAEKPRLVSHGGGLQRARLAAAVAAKDRVVSRGAAAPRHAAAAPPPDGEVLGRVAPAGEGEPPGQLPTLGERSLEGRAARVAQPLTHVHHRVAAESGEALCRHRRPRRRVAQKEGVPPEASARQQSARAALHRTPRRALAMERVAALAALAALAARLRRRAVKALDSHASPTEQRGPVAHPAPHLHDREPELAHRGQRLRRRHCKREQPAGPFSLPPPPAPHERRRGRLLVPRRAAGRPRLCILCRRGEAAAVQQRRRLCPAQPPELVERVV